ncbi:MAG: LysM peptidoglycan-binding domain-containing protein [Candidatus Sericytochromatia bacterium]|nr:LysM peptidoglycan-binding domain-containing protein [Candidatus Sericytochromatia bacterium]
MAPRKRRRKRDTAQIPEGRLLLGPDEHSLQDEFDALQRFLGDRPGTAPILLRRLGELGCEAHIDLRRLRRDRAVRLRHLPSVSRRRQAAARVATMFALAIGGALLSSAPASAQTDSQAVVRGAQESASLILRVMDVGSGKPLSGVRVKTVSDEVVGVTDARGQVQLAQELAREGVLSLEREGYPLQLLEGSKLSGRSMVGMRKFADAGARANGFKLGGASPRQASRSSADAEDPAERLFSLALEHARPRAPYSEAQTAPKGAEGTVVAAKPSPAPQPEVVAAPKPTPAGVAAAPKPTPKPVAAVRPAPSPTPDLFEPPLIVRELPSPSPSTNPEALTLAALPRPAGQAVIAPPARPGLDPLTPPAAPKTSRVAKARALDKVPAVTAQVPVPAVETPTLRAQKRVAKVATADVKSERAEEVVLAKALLDEARSLFDTAPSSRAQKQVAKVASSDTKAPRALRVVMRDDLAALATAPELNPAPSSGKPDGTSPTETPAGTAGTPDGQSQPPAGETPDALALLGQPNDTPVAAPVAAPVAISQPGPAEPPLKGLPVSDEPKLPAAPPRLTALATRETPEADPNAPQKPQLPTIVKAPVRTALRETQPDGAASLGHPGLRLAPRTAPVVGAAQPFLPFPLPRAFQGPQVAVAPPASPQLPQGPLGEGPTAAVAPPSISVKLPGAPRLIPHKPTAVQVAALDDGADGGPDGHLPEGHPPDGMPMDDLGAEPEVSPPVRLRRAPAPAEPPGFPARPATHGGAGKGHAGPAGHAPKGHQAPHSGHAPASRQAPRSGAHAPHSGGAWHGQAQGHGASATGRSPAASAHGGSGHAAHRRGAPPPSYAVSHRRAVRYVVEPGDTLSAIALRELGSEALWTTIYYANRDQLVDPHWLKVGTVLKIPRTSAAMAAAGARVHVVQPGDTLWAIARMHLGDPSKWPKIFAVNRHIIRNPWLIYPGQRIILPLRVASGISDEWGRLSASHERGAAPRT